MNAVVRFLQALGALALAKNGGQANDLTRLLQYVALGVRAGDEGKRQLEEAVAKVEQLVAEDRGLNDEELAELDAAIQDKLARAAAVDLP